MPLGPHVKGASNLRLLTRAGLWRAIGCFRQCAVEAESGTNGNGTAGPSQHAGQTTVAIGRADPTGAAISSGRESRGGVPWGHHGGTRELHGELVMACGCLFALSDGRRIPKGNKATPSLAAIHSMKNFVNPDGHCRPTTVVWPTLRFTFRF
jgi:hypothetical protein